MTQVVVRVEQLTCDIDGRSVLHGVEFELSGRERVGLFGPSGAGKSLLLRCLVGLAPRRARVHGRMRLRDGAELSLGDRRALARARGSQLVLVPQAAVPSLDPIRSIGAQLSEIVRHRATRRKPAELLALVGLEGTVLERLPSELSGGMAQRVCVALAIAAGPNAILADEPTSSLDNVSQRALLGTLDRACTAADSALVLVSHDLAILAEHCDRVLAIVDGAIVQRGTVAELLTRPDPRIESLVSAAIAKDAS